MRAPGGLGQGGNWVRRHLAVGMCKQWGGSEPWPQHLRGFQNTARAQVNRRTCKDALEKRHTWSDVGPSQNL
eukprot:1161736-Pelagomonas_calceolata.AAC.11